MPISMQTTRRHDDVLLEGQLLPAHGLTEQRGAVFSLSFLPMTRIAECDILFNGLQLIWIDAQVGQPQWIVMVASNE